MADLQVTLAVLRDVIDEAGGLASALESPAFAEAFAALWRAGCASELLLDAGQRAWLKTFREGENDATWMIGRQRGKSFAALTLACELAAVQPNSIIRYAALTAKSAKAIVVPTLEQLLLGCPEDVRPEVKDHEGAATFPNGSVITFAGTDNEQFDRLRGPRAHLVLLDEASFYSDLERVESALLPQLTTTQGKALYLSTPPESVAHPFLARYRAAQASGRAVHATVHDNPRLGPQGVARIIRREMARLGLTEAALLASTFWRREYLAEIVTEETRAAVPAWTEAVAAELVTEVARPGFFDAYVGIDLGYAPDPSAALLGWHDVAGNRLVIEYEIEHRAGTAKSFTDAIKTLERETWGVDRYDGTLKALEDELRELPEFLRNLVHSKAPHQPFMRVGDNDLGLLAEMAVVHGLAVMPTEKSDKALAVDFLNQLVGAKRLAIHPRCVRLREQLFSTVWNKSRSGWERTAKDHGDLIDCFVAGTMIETADGPRPIETLRIGDLVHTRAGLRPVTAAARTKPVADLWRLTLSDGRTLIGTPEHPVMTQFGWRALHALTDDCILTEWNPNLLSGADGVGSEHPTQNDATTGSTTVTAYGAPRSTYTEQSGLRHTAPSLPATTFTTSTTTRSTMTSPTLPASAAQSTCEDTCSHQRDASSLEVSPSKQLSPLLRPGTVRLPGRSGTARTQRGFGVMLRWLTLCVRFAVARFGRKSQACQPGPVEKIVSPKSDVVPASTMSPRLAPSVEPTSLKTSTPSRETAPVRVASVRPTGLAGSVYNLSVGDEPEYFAEGILVHNCLVYLARNVRWHRDCRPKAPVIPWGNKPAANATGWDGAFNRKSR